MMGKSERQTNDGEERETGERWGRRTRDSRANDGEERETYMKSKR